MNPSCVPFSGEMSGRTAVIIPIPMNDTDATPSTTTAARKSACGKEMSLPGRLPARIVPART